MLRRSQRVACAAGARAVEQTPEATFVIPQLAEAFPQAQFVHLVRDGRDVVASLLERGWLAGGAAPCGAVDDASDAPLGGHARFWVEPGARREFESQQRCPSLRLGMATLRVDGGVAPCAARPSVASRTSATRT